MKNMGIEGVGPKIMGPTIISLVLIYLLNRMSPEPYRFAIDKNDLAWVFWIFLTIGLIIWAGSVVQLIIGWRKKQLITSGFFKVFLNPIYQSWTFFLIPAVALYLNSWFFLVGSIVLLVATLKFVPAEETYLRETFGKEYDEYRKKVLIKL